MSLLSTAKFLLKSNPVLMLRTARLIDEVYRGAFVATAASEGVLELFREGPRSLSSLHDGLGLAGSEEALESWLDLGVALGELRHSAAGYAMRGTLSRALAEPSNDTTLAYLQARIEVIFQYVTQTPNLLRQGRRFPLDDAYGELFARSSHTVEPILFDVVDRVVPPTGPCRLLEVGCGSGTYIRRACMRNKELRVVGLELSAQAAELARRNLQADGLDDRCAIQCVDVREYQADRAFDLVTFHNLIYYFPREQRLDLLRRLRSTLTSGGRLILSSLARSSHTPTATMNLWCTMTEGCGPLPNPAEIAEQMELAGFTSVDAEQLFPNYWLFIAASPRG